MRMSCRSVEAHRLRNVYKPTNRIANAIKNAISHAPKILLTATPLQNSIQELYGLVSIVDDYTFGDLKSFKAQFGLLRTEEDFAALRERIKPVVQRTLRRQVLEYIKYTNRISEYLEESPHRLARPSAAKVSRWLTTEGCPDEGGKGGEEETPKGENSTSLWRLTRSNPCAMMAQPV